MNLFRKVSLVYCEETVVVYGEFVSLGVSACVNLSLFFSESEVLRDVK